MQNHFLLPFENVIKLYTHFNSSPKQVYMIRIFYLRLYLLGVCKSLSLSHGILLWCCSVSLMKCHTQKNYILLNEFSKNVVTVDKSLMVILEYFLKALALWEYSAIYTSSREFEPSMKRWKRFIKLKIHWDSLKVECVM